MRFLVQFLHVCNIIYRVNRNVIVIGLRLGVRAPDTTGSFVPPLPFLFVATPENIWCSYFIYSDVATVSEALWTVNGCVVGVRLLCHVEAEDDSNGASFSQYTSFSRYAKHDCSVYLPVESDSPRTDLIWFERWYRYGSKGMPTECICRPINVIN